MARSVALPSIQVVLRSQQSSSSFAAGNSQRRLHSSAAQTAPTIQTVALVMFVAERSRKEESGGI